MAHVFCYAFPSGQIMGTASATMRSIYLEKIQLLIINEKGAQEKFRWEIMSCYFFPG